MVRSATPGANLWHAKVFNRRVVLEAIRLHGPTSRAAVARHTGLSIQTISNIADELFEAGLLREQGKLQGSRGAPAPLLALDPGGGFTLGISLDHTRMIVVLVDLAGHQRQRERLTIEGMRPDDVIPLIVQTATTLMRREGAARARLWGAGVVMPLLFEDGRPVAYGPISMPEWHGYPVVERLSAALGRPVLVENDATAAAVGEQLYGVGRRLKDFFYIYIGVGVGGGMILGGHPYRGSAGRAGELGHVVVAPGGRQCACGARGCLERYASLSAAQAQLDGVAEGMTQVDPGRLAANADALEPWLDAAAQHLRTAAVTITNLLDPEAIVIGGIMPNALLTRLIEKLTQASDTQPLRARILQADIDLQSPALGGAALPLFEGLSPAPFLSADMAQWQSAGLA